MSSVSNEVLAACDYHSLPDRYITGLPFHRKHYISYGIMAYCVSTKRWLLVRPLYSYYFSMYLNGNYRKADLQTLVSGMTPPEIRILHQLYIGTIQFTDIYKGRFMEMAKKRFEETKDLIRSYLKYEGTEQPPWTFPKGRIEINETPQECAVREFEEETGLSIEMGTCIDNRRICEKYTSFNQLIYETKCWLYIFDKEPDLIEICADFDEEIAERRWFPSSECYKILSPSKCQMLATAEEILRGSSQLNF